jgi:hypothetical protein
VLLRKSTPFIYNYKNANCYDVTKVLAGAYTKSVRGRHCRGVTGRAYTIWLKSILKVAPWKTERNGDDPGSFPLAVFGFNSVEPSFYPPR